ncbi:Forkhead box protein B1 [Folsomia candida]|uniref:Forkhead box protein B1 n=2 Tax=Folsomia candida TaxID=158441 RepID=A0A226F4M3_FOLCA|nr:Forkhead box protein B1 [Folsomia candida]
MSTSSSNNQQLSSRVSNFTSLAQNNMPPGTGNGGGGVNNQAVPVNNMALSTGAGNIGGLQIPGILSPASALEHYRLSQLYQYAMAAERLRCPPGSFMPPMPPGVRPELFYGPYCRIDPRLAGLCRPPEEPKPQQSYIGLIAMAILSSPEKKLVLSDIYQYILDNFPYFRARGPGWRNSIRHNLSLNDCFIKSGRSANGKGHFWRIHDANVDDFTKGDFRRRRAQRKVRKHMGLAVDDEDSPSPPPSSPPPIWHHPHHPLNHGGVGHMGNPMNLAGSPPGPGLDPATLFGLTAAAAANLSQKPPTGHHHHHPSHLHSVNQTLMLSRKRQFDVASLLAPEKDRSHLSPVSCKSDENSLSSPSPPPTMIKRMNVGKQRNAEDSSTSEHSENEDIEVTEDDTREKSEERIPLGDIDDDRKKIESEHNESANNNSHVQQQQRRSSSAGQGGNSSNDDEDNENQSRHLNSGQQFGLMGMNNSGSNNPLNFAGFHGHGQLNQDSFSQSNLPPHGIMLPLDFIQAQHFIQHHQSQSGGGAGLQNPSNNPSSQLQSSNSSFPFGPGGQNILQQNSSLASLMILSSRYKELTSSMIIASRRSPQ